MAISLQEDLIMEVRVIECYFRITISNMIGDKNSNSYFILLMYVYQLCSIDKIKPSN